MTAYSLALFANFVGLVLSIWLGVYIVTHNRSTWLTWNAGLTLWALAGLFANTLLLMDASPAPASQPIWLRLIFPFWPQEDGGNGSGWTQGWAACLGIFFWYQTTVFIVPGKMAAWRRLSLYAAYALGIFALILQIFLPHLLRVERTDPLFIDTQKFTSIFPLFAFALILYAGLSVFNLLEARRLSPSIIARKQLNMLLNASLIASLATVLAISGTIPGILVPVFWVSSLGVVAVVFFGFGVILYSALLQQRILRRDVTYSGIATGLVVLLYSGTFLWLSATYHITKGIIVVLIPLVILTHSLTEEVRQVLERLIYDKRTRILRSSLGDLSRLASEQADLSVMLSHSLEPICDLVRATYGVILLFEDDDARLAGTCRWHEGKGHFSRKDYEADDTKHLNPGSLSEPFLETTLLVPLYASLEQIGALLLGRPENGIHYSREDVLLLEGPVDRVTDLIVKNRRINDYLDQLIQLPLQQIEPTASLIPVAWVEDAMQNLFDYAYLGDSPLVNLQQVKALLDGATLTHLDKGKAVYRVVNAAIEKLRPESTVPSQPIPREWYPYFILHDAYLDGLPNRDIISKLYISEGTFHRTRRSAIRSVTRVMSELESV